MSTSVLDAEFLTPEETADLLRISVKTVYRQIARGQIPAVRLGQNVGPLRVPVTELEAWLGESRVIPLERRVPEPSTPAVEARAHGGAQR